MALDETEIALICANAATQLLSYSWRLPGYTQNKNFEYEEWCKRLPNINPIYAMTVEHHYEVAIHAESKVFPYEVLKTKAPNQAPEEWDYQRGLWVPYTRSTWTRALNKTKVISNKQNYSVKGWDPEQEKYFFKNYPRWHSLESFFFDIVREAKINYPNQVLLIEPSFIPTKVNEEGKLIADQSKMVDPIVKIIKEKDVIHYQENTLTIIASGTIKFEDREWPLFKAYDAQNIYTIVPESRDSEGRVVYTINTLYEHKWGYVPCRKLGGKPKDIDGDVFYESVFAGAIPDLDEVIRLSSTLTMVLHSNAYPVKIMRNSKCTQMTEGLMCNNGWVWSALHNDGEGGRIKCSACNGTGQGPTTTYTVAENFGNAFPDKFLPLGEVLAYVAPSPETISPLDEQIDKKKETAFAFIFKSSEKIQQTAEGSHLEKDEYHSFLVQFSNEFFDLYEFAIEACGWYRYGDGFVMPSVSKPTTFSFRSPEDITEEITKSRQSMMPVPYDWSLIVEATKTRFNSNPEATEKVLLCMAVNDLWPYEDNELIPYLNKTVTAADMVVKQRDMAFVNRALAEYEDFAQKTVDEQKKIVYAYADEELKKMPQLNNEFAADALANQ